MESYRVEFCNDYSSSMLQELIALMNASFPNCTFGTKYYQWQYLDNPNGKVVSFNAYAEDGTLAAHYAAIPIQMILNRKQEKGLLSLNTATHPNHQGHRLFTTLASKTYQYAKENGYKYVIGVANANSTHGFLKYLGFYLVAPLEFKIGMGDIFKSEIPSDLNHVFYDEQTWKWRLQCPEFRYTALGNTIYSNRPEPLFHTSAAKLPKKVTRESLGLKKTCDIFNIYIGLGANTKNGLYFNLPKFIKRSPFNLIFKDLTDGELPKITKDNIFFQLLDFDVA